MSTLDPSKVLGNIPQGLRDPLFETYKEIASNYAEHRWEPAELNGGKFCEVVYAILDGAISGNFAAVPSKPQNMKDACANLERLPATNKSGDRSMRILIPRMLPPLYEVRNNRGVGHVGGDVDPNLMDATVVYGMTSWIMAELVRVFHQVTTPIAQQAVDALSERKISLVWSTGNIDRVLDPDMSKGDQTLLLLHKSIGWVDERSLCKSVEYSNPTVYRKNVLKPQHKKRLIEYDQKQKTAKISPSGSAYVEETIIKPRLKV